MGKAPTSGQQRSGGQHWPRTKTLRKIVNVQLKNVNLKKENCFQFFEDVLKSPFCISDFLIILKEILLSHLEFIAH